MEFLKNILNENGFMKKKISLIEVLNASLNLKGCLNLKYSYINREGQNQWNASY